MRSGQISESVIPALSILALSMSSLITDIMTEMALLRERLPFLESQRVLMMWL